MKVVLGGGISGLSAAHFLLKRNPKENVTLLEATNRFGGWIKSSINSNGSLIEQGPRTIRPRGKAAITTLKLVEDLKLTDRIVWIPIKHTVALNRMIYVNGKLHSLPASITSLLTRQTPFSKPLISYVLRDLFVKKSVQEDDTIYNFASRRFGKEIADYAISSMICGICAGDAKNISVKFLMDDLFRKEQEYGSVVKGFIYNLLSKKIKPKRQSEFVQRAKHWSVYSFEGGMETLPLTLRQTVEERGGKCLLNAPCNKIDFLNNSASLTLDNETITCDRIVSSLPAHKLAQLIQHQHPKLSDLLKGIPSVTVGVINVEYPGKLLKKEGFGFLVPPCENRPILGVIYDSCSFPNGDRTVLTVMMGGHWFKTYFGDEPNENVLLDTALSEIKDILDISVAPSYHKVQILENCIPQYIVGHSKRVSLIEEYIEVKNLPLSVCGSPYYGVGINDVIQSAKNAVRNIL